MTDSLRLFQSEEEYNAVKNDLEYPTVSYVEGGGIHYTLPPLATPFYIEALADGMTVALNNNDLEYSTDLSTWNTLSMNTASPAINTGERIYLRGNAVVGETGIGQFTISQQCNVGGNIMSLLFNDDFEDKTDLTGYDGAFTRLFMHQPIVNSSKLLLPATTLSNSCYEYMFYHCSALTTAPVLPAITLSTKCYYGMFLSCTSLTTAPELPATTLAESCYMSMFGICVNLTTPPLVLPATKLVRSCYDRMFNGCESLTTSPEIMCESSPAFFIPNNACDNMFIDCSNLTCIKLLGVYFKSDDFSNWVEGVSPTGTFVKNPALSEATIGRGVSGIPEGWTVVDVE